MIGAEIEAKLPEILAQELRLIRGDIRAMRSDMEILQTELIRTRVTHDESRRQFAKAMIKMFTPVLTIGFIIGAIYLIRTL